MNIIKKLILLFIFLSFINPKIFAQGTHTGCIYNDIVYTENPTGTKYNSDVNFFPLSTNYCSWTPTSSVNCTICTNGNGRYNGGGNCTGMGKIEVVGKLGTFTMVLCPLDNYVILFFLLIGTVSLTSIKRMNNVI